MTAIFPPPAGVEPTIFVQASPASAWIIDHNLGRPPAGLQTFDSADTQVYGAVTNPTADRTVVNFNSAFGGKAEYL